MSQGVYGTTGAANIDVENDVDIWYYFRPSRTETDPSFTGFKRLNPREVLVKSTFDDPTLASNGISTNLMGMYDLKLPLTNFNQKGVYTIYIKPKEIITTIQDSDAVLSAFPDIRGIVLKISSLTENQTILENGNLVGYRIDYFNNNGDRQDLFRIVTSNNRVEPVNDNLTDGNQKSIRYRYNDASDLTFLTLTPSSAPNSKPNALPFIGSVDQKIALINTKFNPICLEVEMVDYDEDGLAILIAGNETRSLDDNIITTYNKNNEIFNQVQVYTLKETTTGNEKYQVRENMNDNVDNNKQWDSIVGEV